MRIKNNFSKGLFILLIIISFISCIDIDYYEEDYTTYVSHDRSFPRIKTKGENNQQYIYYPDVNTIKTSAVVLAQMENAWNKMKNSCNENGRREYGFWIYYDNKTNSIWCGGMDSGPFVSYTDTAEIYLRTPENQTQACAFFHTHTSFHFAPIGMSRKTGPSPGDLYFAQIVKVPGILYDYSTLRIWGGQSLEDSHFTYTFGQEQRAPHKL